MVLLYMYTNALDIHINIPVVHVYRIAGKFGGAVGLPTTKLKSAKISSMHINIWRSCTEPPNLNPASMLVMANWDSTAKFNAHQYFRLYGISLIIINFIFTCMYMYVGMQKVYSLQYLDLCHNKITDVSTVIVIRVSHMSMHVA